MDHKVSSRLRALAESAMRTGVCIIVTRRVSGGYRARAYCSGGPAHDFEETARTQLGAIEAVADRLRAGGTIALAANGDGDGHLVRKKNGDRRARRGRKANGGT